MLRSFLRLLVVLWAALGVSAGAATAQSGWDGFYGGAVLGYGTSASVHCDRFCDGDLTNHPRPDGNSALFGVTAGYSVSRGGLVYGIEADLMAG